MQVKAMIDRTEQAAEEARNAARELGAYDTAARFARWVITRRGYVAPAPERVTTDELVEGDLVKLHGYVFRLGAREVYYSHSTEREVYAFDAHVVERPALGDHLIDSTLRAVGVWRVQGNGGATWARIGRVL